MHVHGRVALWGLIVVLAALGTRVSAQEADRFELHPGDSVALVGNSFAERLAMSGYFEALIHSAFPDHRITVRQMPWSGDEVGLQERELNVPDTESYLREYEADVICACFGMSESFRGPEGLARFEEDLRALLARYRAGVYNGETPPRVVLITPICHESAWARDLADAERIDRRNGVISEYASAMERVGAEEGARVVNLHLATALMASEQPWMTTDGILPSEAGCREMARMIGVELGWVHGPPTAGAPEAAARLRALAWDKHYHFRQIYRPTNTEYIWGRRAEPFGVVNFPHEQAQLRRMVDARQRALWEMEKPTPEQLFTEAPTGAPIWETVPSSRDFPEDEWAPPPVMAEGTETSVGDTSILPPEEFAKSFTLADGYVVECFVSERDFPELQNPLAIAFDDRHRLWVLCSPTYPHLLPGERPMDRLIVLSDEDGDGRADRCETFAEGFAIPTGFAIDTDGVYLAHSPDLLRLSDTDGDGRADRREVVLTGFSMPDSHHQISSLEWAPDGGFTLHEGTFGRAAIETARGTVRARDAAIWRYEPNTGYIQVLSHCGFPNPWGHAFDDWGASVLDSTSGGEHFYFSHVSAAFEYPRKPAGVSSFLTRGRPTAGNEIISSRHFPDDVQGSHLVNQMIGFHGTRWDRLFVSGSGWGAEPMPQELIQSSDENYRPVAIKVGPDGTLYICDWSNPLIGHMQYSVRDPRRDHTHGRIWRVRHKDRAPLTPPEIHTASVGELLELLRLPERNTRQLVRRRLQTMDAGVVLPALRSWLGALEPGDVLHDRLVLEALWITHAQRERDSELMRRVLGSASPDARAAALRLLRLWMMMGEIPGHEALVMLEPAVRDPDMRVRLEAVIDCGFAGLAEGAAIAQVAAEMEVDASLEIVLAETLTHLAGYGQADSLAVRRLKLRMMETDALLAEPWDGAVAAVVLERPEVSAEARTRALETLAPDAAARLPTLVDSVLRAREPGRTAFALLPLFLDAASGASGQEPVAPMLAHAHPEVRAVAVASALAAGGSLAERMEADAPATVRALTLLGERPLSEEEAGLIIDAVDAARVEPVVAAGLLIGQAVRSARVGEWIASRVNGASDLPFDPWRAEHEVAMAVLRAAHEAPAEAVPDFLKDHLVPADAARLEAGRAVYYDEALGCVRCHGAGGQGEPGFPPLDRSRYVLGDPRRAAAIVIHGLQGAVEVRDKRIESVMAPLGAVLTDRQIADVLTFVRRSWGNYASPVEVTDVASVRTRPAGAAGPIVTTALLGAYPFAADRIVGVHEPLAAAEGESPGAGVVQPLLLVIVAMVLVMLGALVLQRRAG